MANRVLILGASTRAAAFSALRAGVVPQCIDDFADRDLSAVCPVVRAESREGVSGLERLARGWPGWDWLYTGPVENHPDLIERLSTTNPLLGNDARAVRGVRDPFQVVEILRRHGLSCPDVRSSSTGLPRDGTWFEKPMASGGGRLIRPLDGAHVSFSEPSYFQKRIEGGSFSALFIARKGEATLIGVTHQLIGAPGTPFGYRGSIGPWMISKRLAMRLASMGRVLASAFGLLGLFGVDYILSDDEPWPVEVNPRYTASVEIFELALRRSLLAEHLRACYPECIAPVPRSRLMTGLWRDHVVGKAIVYAQRTIVVPDIPIDGPCRDDPFAVPTIADAPWPETTIQPGEPVMTVFSTGRDQVICESHLQEQVELWSKRLES